MLNIDIDSIVEEGFSRMPRKEFHNREHAERVHEEVQKLAENKGDKQVLRVAAAWHDVGHREKAQKHEERSAEKLDNYLSSKGTDQEFVDQVKNAILSTKMTPDGKHTNILSTNGEKLADADVHNFGLEWKDFRERNKQVRDELGIPSGEDWIESSIDLLETHNWNHKGGGIWDNKQKNIYKLRQILDEKY